MELDITDFFANAAPRDYQASVAEIGNNAGAYTWRAACDDAPDYNLLDTDDKRDAFRAHIRGFGAWNDAEIAAWPDVELTALLIQCIAGDMRDAGMDASNWDWEEYERGANAGTYSGRICRGDDSRVYYYIGE